VKTFQKRGFVERRIFPLAKFTCNMTFLRTLVFALCFFAVSRLSGQISDNFSDGNFDQNPAWQGDVASFIVNAAGELQLNAAAAGAAYLTVPGNIPTSAVWDLQFRLTFAPSAANLLRIYLLSDAANPATANGYYLEIGETGSNDALRLFRQDGSSSTLLGTGVAGLVATNPDIHVVVTRSASGEWSVQAASGSGTLAPQFTATDAQHAGGANRFFGVQCLYTVSNINRFYFDNIQISLGAPDTTPPVLLSATADNSTQVTAVFNEALDAVSAANTSLYNLSGGIGAPTNAVLQPNGFSVVLTLPTALSTGNYTLECTDIQDVANNTSAVQSVTFQYTEPVVAAAFDLLINEIMADPTPSQGLPEAEWLELYNRSDKVFDLSQFQIQDATGPLVPLPTYLLQPGAYVVVTSGLNLTSMQAVAGSAVVGTSLGTSVLNNDGDVLTLVDAGGQVIDRVAYDVDWHSSSLKKDGGWSLERVNPNSPCLGSSNWQSSTAANGGTPAQANAVLNNAPDTTPPAWAQVTIESGTSLLVQFSEGMDIAAVENPLAYRLFPPQNITAATLLPNSREQVRLTLGNNLQPSTVYALVAAGTLPDCSGNTLSLTDTLYFGVAEAPEWHDVIIHEIMAKPAPSAGLPEVEWLELYNRSDKIIDLSSLRLQDLSSAPVTLPVKLLLPGQFVALVAQANAALLQSNTTGTVLGASMSSSLLNDDGDIITLSDQAGNTIDRVLYDPSWHTTEGKEDGGWSLERINPALPCLGSENWQSCPVLPGGTPGKANASFRVTTDEQAPRLLWAYPENAQTLLLTFTEGLAQSSLIHTDAFQVEPGLNVLTVTQQPTVMQLRLTLDAPMQEGVLYTITTTALLEDCSGNSIPETDTILTGLPQQPEPLDIVVNEVMYNPATGNARYIEFYNNSQKIIDWRQCFIADLSSPVNSDQIIQNRIAIPGQYHVFTSDGPNIRAGFANIIQRNVMENDIPSLDSKAGNVTLYWVQNGDTVVLDGLDYRDGWHNGLYSVGDRDGVALERIRVNGPTNDAANWTSASSTKTGAPGTPTLPNSQELNSVTGTDNLIQLNPARVSPDDDGYEDFLDIQYQFPQAGYGASAAIYDADGNRIKTLARQQLAGTEGTLRWDGDTDQGTKARPGIHILWVELFHPDGSVRTLKRVFVVVQ
jgi:Lamin Tail Domain/Bacterial Ig-like domain